MGFEFEIMQLVQFLALYGEKLWDTVFIFFTFLAEESFLLIAVFIIYWCINKKLGEYILLSMYVTLSSNGIIKDLVRRPRPFLTTGYEEIRYIKVDHFLVNTVKLDTSFSFPSGHSQCAGSFYTALMFWIKKKWAYVAFPILILGIMTSRVYLGVHFPTDVLFGALLGILSSIISWWLFNKYYQKRLCVLAVAVAISSLGLLIVPSSDTVKTIGVGVGAVVGLFLDDRYLHSDVAKSMKTRIIRLVIGLTIVLIFKSGLKVIFPSNLLFDGLRYFFVGITATGLVPFIFKKLKI